MSDEAVNAVVEEVVPSVAEETAKPEVKEEVAVDNSEVAPEAKSEEPKDTKEKPKQSAEDNAKWAETRRKIEKDALDKAAKKFQELNGWDESLGTWEAYEKAVNDERVKKEAEEKGVDPEMIREIEDLRAKNSKYSEQEAKQKMYLEFREVFPDTSFTDIPRDIWDKGHKDHNLTDLYARHELKRVRKETADAKAVDETNKSNAEASTGSVQGKTEVSGDGYISQSEFNANKNKPGWIESKWDIVMKSMGAGKIKSQ